MASRSTDGHHDDATTDRTAMNDRTARTRETARLRRRPIDRWRVALVPVAIMTPLAFTACGGSDDPSATAADDGPALSSDGESAQGRNGPGSEELQSYVSCLQEQGLTVELPQGSNGGPGGDQLSEPPADGEMPKPPEGAEGEMPVDGEMPAPPEGADAPEASQGGPPSGAPGVGAMLGLDTSDATVQAAMEACSDLEPQMPERGPRGAQDGTQQDGTQPDGQEESEQPADTTG